MLSWQERESGGKVAIAIVLNEMKSGVYCNNNSILEKEEILFIRDDDDDDDAL